MRDFMDKKIVMFIGSLHGGGAEKQFLLQAKFLSAFGYNVTIYSLEKKKNDKEFLGDKKSNLDIEYLVDLNNKSKIKKIVLLLQTPFLLRQRLKNEQIILYSWLEIPNFISGIASIFKKNVRNVWAIRNSSIVSGKLSFIQKLNKIFSKEISLIANSKRGLDFYMENLKYKASKSEVIYNFIEDKKFYPVCLDKKNKLRKKYGFLESDFIILSVSRVIPKKNVDKIIYQFYMFDSEDSDNKRNKLLIVGKYSESYKRVLDRMVSQYHLESKVIFAGDIRFNIEEFYNIADVYVLLSSDEGFSNTLYESVSCGVFSLSTDVGDNRKLLSKDQIIIDINDTYKKILDFKNKNIMQTISVLVNNQTEQKKLIEFMRSM